MPSLTENILNRVRKLAKPSNNSQAMQPIFEAVSNSLYAIEDKSEKQSGFRGRVDVRITSLEDHRKIEIEGSSLFRVGKGGGRCEWRGAWRGDRGYRLGMRDTDLFQVALGLSSPWTVTRSEFDVEDGRLDLYLDFARGSRFACADCGREGCPVHDTNDETWRHLDFFQHRTYLHARVPRATCPDCGTRKVATPWARAGSGFTLLFEAYLLALAKAMPIANAAKRLGEHDTRSWRVVEHYVWRAVEKLDLSEVRRIAADETSARRGHDYISLFVDMARRKVIYVTEGKDAATVKAFAEFLEARGGDREAISDASIEMGAAFEAGIKENFPNAEITFDKFHVVKLANEAVDEVRRQEAKNNFQIKGRRYIFLKNVDRLTKEEKETLSELEAQNLDTTQAMQIRMNLQQLFTMDAKTARRFLDRWNTWVQISDLGPMKKLAKTIMGKAEGILRSIGAGLSNGVLEAINGNVQAAKRKAKGYRSKRTLKAIVYLIAGDVLANSPT